MDIVVRTIEDQLDSIEKANGVRILYAVESGSRAWGFASADSDYDVRFLYVRPTTDYLTVRPRRDVIELPLTGDLDTSGWDLVKALNLFRASNPALLEWLNSPTIYREATDLAERLRELAAAHASPRRMGYHYLSMARGQFREYVEGKARVGLKKYLYVIRPLLCLLWLERYGTPPPTAVETLCKGIELPPDVAEQFAALLERKRGAIELGLAEPIPTLTDYCRREIDRFDVIVPLMQDRNMDVGPLDSLFHNVLGIQA